MRFLAKNSDRVASLVWSSALCVACGGSSFQSSGAGGSANGAAGGAAADGGNTAGTVGGSASANAGSASANGGSTAMGQGGSSAGAPTTSGGDAGAGDSAYRAAILADSPLVYWRMGSVNARVVPDETGGGNDLVLQGSGHELGVDGAIANDSDGAIGFDGVASFAIATDARALDFTGDAAFTLECWAKRSAGGQSYFQYLVSDVQGSAGNRNGYSLYLLPAPSGGDSARSVFEYDLPAADLGVWGPLPDEDSWTHYAAVYDGTNTTLYVNGTLTNSSVVGTSVLPRTVPFTVARGSDPSGSFFKGALDELAVYPSALSVAQIARHFALGK